MPDPWLPGAIRDPGLNANYRRGRSIAQVDRAHETVGRDSRALIRDRGLAQFLLPKIGPAIQFGPDDAVHSDACEWATLGCGIELERFPGEPATPDQIEWAGRILRWRHEQRGIPLDHWAKERGRLPLGSPWRGTADHGGLVHRKCDQHTDGWSDAEYAAMTGASPTATRAKDDEMYFLKDINAQDNQPTFFHEVTGYSHRQMGANDKPYIDQHRASGVQVIALAASWLAAHLANLDAQRAKLVAQIAAAVPATSGGAPPPPAQVDLAAVAKAVNDDAAKRLAS